MPALTLQGEYVDLSYTYDALTVYPRFQDRVGDVVSCVSKCSQFGFVMKASPDDLDLPTRRGVQQQACFAGIERTAGIQRTIHRYDDDHDLYHQDAFQIEDSHYHLKFYRALTREQLEQVLDLFVESDLLIKEQRDAFLKTFDARYATLNQAADDACKPEEKSDETVQARKKASMEALLKLIRSCRDNDKLVNLHDHLLKEKYDYLRIITEEHHSKEWQGVDRTGKVVKTSKAWATLEKALSLQMIKNLQDQCRRFSPQFGAERTKQLAATHTFFGIKRTRSLTDPSRARTFKTLDAFSRADEDVLARKYQKVFKV